MQKHRGEREHGSWKEILWDLLIMLGLKEEAIKYSYMSEIAEEIERKRRWERNRSQRELELDKAE